MTAAPGKELKEGETYLVTILPPMQVATDYLKRLSISPTSKLTDIAMLTLNEK